MRNPDGSVTLALEYPVTISYRTPGGPEQRQEVFSELTMRQLFGRDMRKVLVAKGVRSSQMAIALAAGLSPAKMAMLFGKMDASDTTAAQAVVATMMGMDAEQGLPASATVDGASGAITLPLATPAEPEGFEPRYELVFRRLRGDDLIAIAQSKDTLPAALARATGLTPKEANELFDAMDAVDIMAMQRVIGFLSGSGRRAGN